MTNIPADFSARYGTSSLSNPLTYVSIQFYKYLINILTQKIFKHISTVDYINWVFSYNELQTMFLYPMENTCFSKGITHISKSGYHFISVKIPTALLKTT